MNKLLALIAIPVAAVALLLGTASAALPATVHVGETVTFQATPCAPACSVTWTVTRRDPILNKTITLFTTTRPTFQWTFDTSTVTVQELERRGNGTNGIVEQLQTTYLPVP